MTRHLYIQTMRILLMCVLVQLAGCSRRELDSLPEESMYGEVYLNINLNIDSGDSYSRAGRPDDEEDLVDGVGRENAINTLHMFWKENNAWRVVELNKSDFIFTGNKGNVKIAFDKNDYPTLGGIEMWLGANLSTRQADAFMGTGIYNLETTSDWVNELAPMYSDFSGRDDIAMFCVKSSETTLVSPAPDEEYSVSFDLKRLVAKVMVACKEDNQGYVPVVSKNGTDFQGWIKRKEVLYTLNGVNRSTYVGQVVDGENYDANVIDPNPDLKYYTDLYNKDKKEYLSIVNNHFYYYDVTDLMLKNGLYKEAKLIDDNGNYTDGIYCPENSFLPSTADDDATLKSNPLAWGMITSVSIKAKFTPKMLYVEGGLFDFILRRNDEDLKGIKSDVEDLKEKIGSINNSEYYQVYCSFEKVAKAFLKYSLIYNGFLQEEIGTGNGFLDETYFYHADQNEYYTYGAAKLAFGAPDNTTELGNYRPYYDGWGFYYTYIDNRHRLNKNGDFVFYKHGQVERNRYYILTINSFSNPGSSAGNPSYVEVNTEMIPWKSGGQGNITLE